MKIRLNELYGLSDTSYAWVDPLGEMHVLENKVHRRWAVDNIKNFYPDYSGKDAYEELFQRGWVAIMNAGNYTALHGISSLTMEQCQTLLEFLIVAASEGILGPDDDVRFASLVPYTTKKMSAVDYSFKLGGDRGTDKFFASLKENKVLTMTVKTLKNVIRRISESYETENVNTMDIWDAGYEMHYRFPEQNDVDWAFIKACKTDRRLPDNCVEGTPNFWKIYTEFCDGWKAARENNLA